MSGSLIEVSQVAKSYGNHSVLKDFSFQVGRGEILGLLGPNGSGKTTTIRLVNGVIRPDSGAIRVNGYNAGVDGDAIRRISGILTESAAFYQHMTGLQNLQFFAKLYGVREPQRPAALLAEFGLEAAPNQKVGTYSTGMKKRLGLAKALLHRPEILFLDEPTNGLDPEGIRMVLEAIHRLNQRDGTTMILCSHLLAQLERVCHRYVFLDGGRLIEEGTLAELESKYLTQVDLEVETDMALAGDTYRSLPAVRLAPDRIRLTLPGKRAVPEVLRQLSADASVYGAALMGHDLESIYFKIREVAHHE